MIMPFSGVIVFFAAVSFLSPFTWANAAFLAAAYFVLTRFVEKGRAFTTVSFATIAFWISVFLSRRTLPTANPVDIHAPMAVAGFPLPALWYPYPPTGSDVSPLGMWPAFFANYTLFIVVVALVSRPLHRAVAAKLTKGYPVRVALHMVAVCVALFGFAQTLIAFD